MKCLSLFIIGAMCACALLSADVSRAQTVGELKQLLLSDPNSYAGHYELGVRYTLDKMYDSALAEYQTAIEIYPRYSLAHHAIYCTEILKDPSLLSDFAKESLPPERGRKVTEIKEHNNIAFYADPFFDQSMAGLFVKAEVFYKPVDNKLYENFGIKVYRRLDGINRFFHGDFAYAIDDLTLLIQDYPFFTQAYYFRGLAYARIGFYAEAIADFQHIIDKMDEYNKTKIVPVYLNSAHLYYMIGYSYLQLQRFYPAEGAFKSALEQDLGLFMAQFQLCLVDCMKGSFNPAIEKLNAAIAIKPDDPILHYDKGSLLIRQARFQEAAAEIKIALSMSPRYAPLYLNLARAYEKMDSTSAAIEQFRKYIQMASTRDSTDIREARSSINRLSK